MFISAFSSFHFVGVLLCVYEIGDFMLTSTNQSLQTSRGGGVHPEQLACLDLWKLIINFTIIDAANPENALLDFARLKRVCKTFNAILNNFKFLYLVAIDTKANVRGFRSAQMIQTEHDAVLAKNSTTYCIHVALSHGESETQKMIKRQETKSCVVYPELKRCNHGISNRDHIQKLLPYIKLLKVPTREEKRQEEDENTKNATNKIFPARVLFPEHDNDENNKSNKKRKIVSTQ